MAGRPSIRRRLLIGLITAIILIWSIAFVHVMFGTRNEVEEVYDANLAQAARVLASLLSHEADEETEVMQKLKAVLAELGPDALQRSPTLAQVVKERLGNGSDEDYLRLFDIDRSPGNRYESKIAFFVRYADDKVMLRSPNAPTFKSFREGYVTHDIAPNTWRVFGLRDPGSGLMVQVAEKSEVRQETVDHILQNSLWPLLVSLPLLGLIIWISVGKGLRPLHQVAESVERRDPNSLQPISTESVPVEVVPMVESLNRLFKRVGQALANERRFTANAAHELRTPLAALKTYVQAKQLSGDGGQHADFFTTVVQGVDRTTHMLEQLLTLARADSQQESTVLSGRADLHTIAISVLSLLGPQALDKNIDLSLDADDAPATVTGDSTALEILLRNLVDNAIRYTPDGGVIRVELRTTPESVSWTVLDNGPGIQPPSHRELVFQRFQRGEGIKARGSGLGLSIVKQIAELHRAEIRLSEGLNGKGLSISVAFPMEHT